MKIILTGGGSGGHFYPLISVAEALQDLSKKRKLLPPKIYYMASTPYNSSLLFENDITFIATSAGKMRRYFSPLNIVDFFKTAVGVVSGLIKIWTIYPDVIFSKGGMISFPAVISARILRIPLIIHESDSVPGRANLWAAKFAKRIAVSYPEAEHFFPKEKVAYTGNPVRKELLSIQSEGAHEFLKLSSLIPVILILGGSQGSTLINDTLIDALPELVKKYQIIHQTGKNNIKEVKGTADIVLANSEFKERYKPFDYLNTLAMRMSAGVANLVISRGGSTIFEIAAWGIPSIIIPITDSNGDHQRKNAYSYARAGGTVVIEEENLNSHIFISEIDRLMENQKEREKMIAAAKSFARLDAAETIANEILEIALTHES